MAFPPWRFIAYMAWSARAISDATESPSRACAAPMLAVTATATPSTLAQSRRMRSCRTGFDGEVVGVAGIASRIEQFQLSDVRRGGHQR